MSFMNNLQEDLIKELAQKNNWNYVITRPSLIIGISKASAMNFALNLAIYAAVQKEKGEPLIFPGNAFAWNAITDHSSSLTNARFQLWSSTNKQTANQVFNIHDGDKVRFRTIWPKIEEYFGFSHYEQKFSEDKTVPNLILPEYMPKQNELWEQMAKRYNIDAGAFELTSWMFMHIIVNLPFSPEGDLSKARIYGWTTTTDTAASYTQCFDKLKAMKIIPK
ncbi:unnamed protein product [Rotaria magnacalcarata]|uniref:PRISE-like Rossmann-fold domain-containing protein n=1 Tax=Rotaria magnacalcarata TaxID=392030 RepID=A0A816CXW5_9BILA|nr:unnamed protein product [Rotaria magnacalcarata]CAF4137014.1 unnamed protein product [Rotaria magnacalcarata]